MIYQIKNKYAKFLYSYYSESNNVVESNTNLLVYVNVNKVETSILDGIKKHTIKY